MIVWFKKLGLPILFGILILPMAIEYLDLLAQRKYYSLSPWFFLIIVTLFCFRWKKSEPANDRPYRCFSHGLLAMVIVSMVLTYLFNSSWMGGFAFVLAMAAWALELSSKRKIQNLFGCWCLLFLLIRIPDQLELRFMNWFEVISANAGSVILDYMGILHFVQASVISLESKEIVLADICNGPVSVISSLAAAAFICVLRNRVILHTFLMLLLSIVITLILNVIRVIAVSLVTLRYDVDLLVGGWFLVFSIVSFLFTLILILSADALCRFFLHKTINKLQENDEARRAEQSLLSRIYNTIVGFSISSVLNKFRTEKPPSNFLPTAKLKLATVILLIPLLGLEGVILYYKYGLHISNADTMHKEGDLVKLHEASVKFNRPGWKLVKYQEQRRPFASIWGARSSIWTVKFNQTTLVFALDYPFNQWHDVKACYAKIGWMPYSEKIVKDNSLSSWWASETRMRTPSGDYGYILCSHCDHLGNTVEPKPAKHDINMLRYRLSPERLPAPFGSSMDKNRKTFYQTQAMVSTVQPLDESTIKEIQAMYAEFRAQTRAGIMKVTRK